MSSCCCSLPGPINVFRHLDACQLQSVQTLSQLQNRHDPLSLGSGSGSASSAASTSLCFRIATRASCVSAWSWGCNSKMSSASRRHRLGNDCIAVEYRRKTKYSPSFCKAHYLFRYWLDPKSLQARLSYFYTCCLNHVLLLHKQPCAGTLTGGWSDRVADRLTGWHCVSLIPGWFADWLTALLGLWLPCQHDGGSLYVGRNMLQ
jgi:hypothetical protein